MTAADSPPADADAGTRRSVCVVMDPIERITSYKDTTFAMLLAAAARGWDVHVALAADLYLVDGRAFAARRRVRVFDDPERWFEAVAPEDAPLADHDIVLMRVDPPFDMDFVYATHVLERAEAEGALVGNRPRSLRDVNEKLFTAWFAELCPPTLVTASRARLRAFVAEHEDAIVKPLDGMGGAGIYRLTPRDPNLGMILETITLGDTRQIMAQRYLPEIADGDKRVLVVGGRPAELMLARVPAQGETRGNLAAGGRGEPRPLGEVERRIAETVAPTLLERGLDFVGLDVIGDRLTEINVTSPTCARELDAHAQGRRVTDIDASRPYVRGIADDYLDVLERRLAERRNAGAPGRTSGDPLA